MFGIVNHFTNKRVIIRKFFNYGLHFPQSNHGLQYIQLTLNRRMISNPLNKPPNIFLLPTN